MNKTDLRFNEDVRKDIIAGVTKIADAVVTTLGPKGQNVLISSEYGAPAVVHDGVTVASYINLENERENQAALLIKQSAQKSNLDTGDGTTSTVLLASEITKKGVSLVSSGMNGMNIRKGINLAIADVVGLLKKMAKPVKQAEWKDIATVSAQDEEIGEIVAQAFKEIGKDGSIQVEEGGNGRVDIEVQEGMSFESGYVNYHFVTNYSSMTAVYEEARLLITDRQVTSDADLQAIAKIISTEQRPLVIISEGLSDRVLVTLAQNKVQNGYQILPINPPEFAQKRSQMLEDIAIATGAKLISKDLGMKVSDASVSDLGYIKKIVVDHNSTIISFDPATAKSLVKDRIAVIKSQLEKEDNEFNQEFLRKRIAKLSSGVAVIFAGGKTDVESKELRERIKDAVGATRSAIEEGIVVGGGTALYQIAKELSGKVHDNTEIAAGYRIVLDSLTKPLEMLAKNSGKNSGQIMEQINNLTEADGTLDWGFNAYTEEVSNLKMDKIFDPVKVIRVAVENAGSTAGALITTACSVVQIKKEEKNAI